MAIIAEGKGIEVKILWFLTDLVHRYKASKICPQRRDL